MRLLPKKSDTTQGKKHIRNVPVKLIRPEADQHKLHVDTQFAKASITHLENLASMLGPGDVFFLSQDDKCRVPIGITAAKKQGPLLMHMQYRVSLPDHDWVVGDRHKLIPSVYAGVCIQPDAFNRPDAVSYSGPTFVVIRSGKHSSSNATTHANDLSALVELAEFKDLVRDHEGEIKPVFIITTDGGPDENPRYATVIAHAMQH